MWLQRRRYRNHRQVQRTARDPRPRTWEKDQAEPRQPLEIAEAGQLPEEQERSLHELFVRPRGYNPLQLVYPRQRGNEKDLVIMPDEKINHRVHLIIGPPEAGKSVLMRWICYTLRKRFKKIFYMGKDPGRVVEFIPKKQICDHFDEEQLSTIIDKAHEKNEEGEVKVPILLILDDVSAWARQVHESKALIDICTNSRHLGITCLMCVHRYTTCPKIGRDAAHTTFVLGQKSKINYEEIVDEINFMDSRKQMVDFLMTWTQSKWFVAIEGRTDTQQPSERLCVGKAPLLSGHFRVGTTLMSQTGEDHIDDVYRVFRTKEERPYNEESDVEITHAPLIQTMPKSKYNRRRHESSDEEDLSEEAAINEEVHNDLYREQQQKNMKALGIFPSSDDDDKQERRSCFGKLGGLFS